MALSDEIMSRYRARSGGGGESESKSEDKGETESKGKHTAGKALLAAIRRGDPEAIEEAVLACKSTDY